MNVIQLLSVCMMVSAVLSGTIDRVESGWVVVEMEEGPSQMYLPESLFSAPPNEGMCVSIEIKEDQLRTSKREEQVKELLASLEK